MDGREPCFSRTFSLLAHGGMLTSSGFKTPNPELYDRIQEVYSLYFKPATLYRHGSFGYRNALLYGFCDLERRQYKPRRILSADEYAAYCGTHCDHLVLEDAHVLYLAREPL